MASLNKLQIIGNLGRDPEVKQVGEKTVATFSVAVTEGRGANETVTWFEAEAWDKLAGIVGQYLTKGKSVYVEGRIKVDTWEKDGVKKSRHKVVASNIQLLSKKEDVPF